MAAACKFCCLALLALCTIVIFTTADDKNDDHDKDLYNRPHSHLDHHRKPAKPKPRHHHKHNPKPITGHYHKHTPKPVKIVPTINKAALEVGTVSILVTVLSLFYLASMIIRAKNVKIDEKLSTIM